MRIQAKPTLYKGVRFRSRLEARWAVFFDSLGLRWLYEPKTDAVGYMPDFDLDAGYAEVKSPAWLDQSLAGQDADIDRWLSFARVVSRPLFVFFGGPGEWTNGVPDDTSGLTQVMRFTLAGAQSCTWAECDRCGTISIAPTNRRICDCSLPWGRQIGYAISDVRDHSFEDAP